LNQKPIHNIEGYLSEVAFEKDDRVLLKIIGKERGIREEAEFKGR
jgi:hypothetical protein